MLKFSDRPVAGRYAAALFGAAERARKADQVGEELARLTRLVGSSPEFRAALRHPRLLPQVKADLAAAALGKASDLLRNFLPILFEKKRLEGLPDIARRYQQLADRAKGIHTVQVDSSIPLSAAQTKSLTGALEKALGQVRLATGVNPGLIGGLVVRVGDRLWDASLAGQLERLKESLLNSN